MNSFESFACDFHLSDYDPNMSFAQVLDAITDSDESISVWEQVEDLPAHQLIESIEGMAIALSNRFIPK